MFRILRTIVGVLLVGATTGSAAALPTDSGPIDRPSEASAEQGPQSESIADVPTIRQAIAVLDELTESELDQWLPWLVNMIHGQPDVHIASRLSQSLDEKLERLRGQPHQAEATESVGEVRFTDQERTGFEALFKRELAPSPPEKEIRRQIDALVLDPKKPELALNQAVEIAGAIEHIQNPDLRAALMRFLEDRLMALQGL